MRVHTWEIAPPSWRSDIYLPLVLDDDASCGTRWRGIALGPRWLCNRAMGHGGRHAATTSDGMVCAVWGDA